MSEHRVPPLSITIPGKPIAQGRPRGFSPKGSPAIRFYDPQAKEKKQVSMMMAREVPDRGIDEPVRLCMKFVMPIVSGMKKAIVDTIRNGGWIPHVKKSDIDNMVKFYMDCISMAGIWRDDSIVCSLRADKFYGDKPRTEVKIERQTT